MQSQIQVSSLPAGQVGLKLTTPDELNEKIAEQSLTLFKGSEIDISEFIEDVYIPVENLHPIENQFFKTILKNKKFNSNILGEKTLTNAQNILLALFPPQIKPTGNFGFSAKELGTINTLIKTKNVVLYLFGNPYVLNHIDTKNTKATIIVYQHFKVFQEVATSHFLRKLKAKGKLSVSI